MRRRTLIPWLVLVTGCASGPPRRGEAAALEPLPRVFGGVTWTTGVPELMALFPKTDIHTTTWTCERSDCITYVLTRSDWPAFGTGNLSVSGHPGEGPRLVDLTADDPREACNLSAHDVRPDDCANVPGPKLDALFDAMHEVLRKELGPGKPIEGYSGDVVAHDPRERAVRWDRGVYPVTLAEGAEEFGWSVSVQAFRGWTDAVSER